MQLPGIEGSRSKDIPGEVQPPQDPCLNSGSAGVARNLVEQVAVACKTRPAFRLRAKRHPRTMSEIGGM